MQPSLGDEPQRSGLRQVVAEVDLDVVVSSEALVLAAAKSVEVLAVKFAEKLGHIRTLIVDRLQNGVRRRDGGNGRFDRGNHKPFIGENLSACWMVDHHQ